MGLAVNGRMADGSYRRGEVSVVRTTVGIGIAGALGAIARYGLEGLVSRRSGSAFPWGTFVVNVSGAFALGLVFTVLTER